MDLQAKIEPGSPPEFSSSSHRNLNEMSVSDLVSELRTTFLFDKFERIQEVLIARDARLKVEIASLQEKIEVARLDKIQAEEELKKREELCQKGKRAQECYEKLLKEVKKNGLVNMNTIEELRNKNRELVAENCRLRELNQKLEYERVELEARKKNWEDDKSALDALGMRNCVLEKATKKNLAANDKSATGELRAENTRLLDEKCRLEALVESKERKFWELNQMVLKLEDDVKLLMSVDASGSGGNADWKEPKPDPEELKELNEMDVRGCNAGSDTLHRNEDAHHSLGAGIVQSPSKMKKDAPDTSAKGRSELEDIIEILDSDSDDDDDRRRKKNLSTRMQTIEILKRKFSFSDSSYSSSGSGSCSDLPLNFHDIIGNKKRKTEVDSPALNSLPR